MTRNSEKIRLHVHDLVFAVPIARVEVLHPIGLEQHGAVDELCLLRAGVVPEGVGVPEGGVGGVLEGTSTIGAGGEGQKPAVGGEAAVGFRHGVDGGGGVRGRRGLG